MCEIRGPARIIDNFDCRAKLLLLLDCRFIRLYLDNRTRLFPSVVEPVKSRTAILNSSFLRLAGSTVVAKLVTMKLVSQLSRNTMRI